MSEDYCGARGAAVTAGDQGRASGETVATSFGSGVSRRRSHVVTQAWAREERRQ